MFTQLTLSGVLCALAAPALATVITVNENGIGTAGAVALTSSITADTGPGGSSSALTYKLPFAGVQGDVLLFDPNLGFPGDLVRFNGNGTLVFYSDNATGIDSPADTANPPSGSYTNQVVVNEAGTANNNSATYAPNPGDPGYDASQPSYKLISDTVPEPATPSLMTIGFGLLAGTGLIKRRMRRS